MSKKLAIKGHPTRGEEVIELLKMMGGRSDCGVSGSVPHHYYYLNTPTYIDAFAFESDFFIRNKNNFAFYTLEEFLDEYPFKIGDKVVDGYGNLLTIKAMSWSEDCETMVYDFEDAVIVLAAEDLELFKEDSEGDENMKDKGDKLFDSIIWHLRNSVNNGKQDISGGDCERYFRELVDKVKETITPTPDITANVIDKNNCDIECPDGYEFYGETGNLIGNKVMMRPKKSKYPATFEECLNILYCKSILRPIIGHKAELLLNLEKLLICRDAYWKIAGEQMGLDKPWEPDEEDEIFIIGYNRISGIYKSNGICTDNFILSFPTAEMRDAFYENFEKKIEQCKKLL